MPLEKKKKKGQSLYHIDICGVAKQGMAAGVEESHAITAVKDIVAGSVRGKHINALQQWNKALTHFLL
jgi:hypothetical protein